MRISDWSSDVCSSDLHPLYAGFFLAFWAPPAMTVGHLLLSAGLSLYMLIAIRLEELHLLDIFREASAAFPRRVVLLVPPTGRLPRPPVPPPFPTSLFNCHVLSRPAFSSCHRPFLHT